MAAISQWDAVVIGGGVAGSAAALQLAKAGQRVLLLEKERQAHHKVCGEFISWEAQHYLAQLGIDLTALGAVPIGRARLIRGAKMVVAELPFQAFSLSRLVLDEALLRSAAAYGVKIQRGATVTDFMQLDDGKWQVAFNTFNHPQIVQTASVFLASGKHDIRGQPRPPGIQNNLIGFKMYFQNDNQHIHTAAVDIILFEGGYAGVEQVENQQLNLCLVITKEKFATLGKSWPNLLAALLAQTPALAERLTNAQPCWAKPLAVFGIPYGMINAVEKAPKLYRLGDQMAVIPSFCGNGISIALHTAALAVNSYFHHDNQHYQRQLRHGLKTKLQVATWLSYLAITDYSQASLFTLCHRIPALMRYVFMQTRLY